MLLSKNVISHFLHLLNVIRTKRLEEEVIKFLPLRRCYKPLKEVGINTDKVIYNLLLIINQYNQL